MADARVAQSVVEAIVIANPAARVAQSVIEVIAIAAVAPFSSTRSGPQVGGGGATYFYCPPPECDFRAQLARQHQADIARHPITPAEAAIILAYRRMRGLK